MPVTEITRMGHDRSQWDDAFYAFLAEKERRSGSIRTVQSYSRMLQHFFAGTAKTPDAVNSQDVFGWAHVIGLSGKHPSSVTVGARIACLSSFYRFLIRMDLAVGNPCERLERPKTVPGVKGMSGDQIQRLLAVIPDTRTGLRDRAIILTLTFTGRRRAEVMGRKAGNLIFDGETVQYSYGGKGGKSGKRELPQPADEAIVRELDAWERRLESMAPDESLWPSASNPRGLTSGTFYGNLRRYQKRAGLPLTGVHAFRHSAAKLRRDVGESVEEVSRFLDHSDLGVTTVYLRRLEGQRDEGWVKVAERIGV